MDLKEALLLYAQSQRSQAKGAAAAFESALEVMLRHILNNCRVILNNCRVVVVLVLVVCCEGLWRVVGGGGVEGS